MPPAFDPFEDLAGVLLSVQASAGTGKTHALADLATRFLAAGSTTASELLVVTFTRAATGELRSRLRTRVAEAAAHLHSTVVAGSSPIDDEFLRQLGAEGDATAASQRLERLERALSEFDAATITTIHGFATQVLAALGVGSGVPVGIGFADDGDRRLLEACADVLVRAAVEPVLPAGLPADLPSYESLVRRVRSAVATPEVDITPRADDPHAPGGAVVLAELVRSARELMAERRRLDAAQSFDDLLVRLRDALRGGGVPDRATGRAPTSSGGVAATLRTRFRIALIDEFQDTDPVQWEIFRTLFASEGPAGANGLDPTSTLVLVGDPKQAIYSFRGADVRTYVAATSVTPGLRRRTLHTNWRSDARVLVATSTLLEGVDFGEGISFSSVEAAPAHRDTCAVVERPGGSSEPVAALEVRCGTASDLLDAEGSITTPRAREAITADLVARTIHLLHSCRIPDDRTGAERSDRRALRPSDIAVLVRSNSEAETMHSGLLASGVPAVLARGASVVDSPAADQMRWLLEALVRPADPRRARTFALSWFGPWSPRELADATEHDLLQLQERLHAWNAVLTTRGPVELFRAVWSTSGVVARILERPDGDRSVTDLEHLCELLRREAGDAPLSAAGLLGTLAELRSGVAVQLDTDRDTDLTSRRVESDAEAVQIMTVWVAKGLEFPVVLCPTLWSNSPVGVRYHDPDSGRRTLDVRARSKITKKEQMEEPLRLAAEAAQAEELRLLYVALTRARHHTSLWWVDTSSAAKSALAKVLFHRGADGSLVTDLVGVDDVKASLPEHAATLARLQPLVERSGGTIGLSPFGAPVRPSPEWAGADGQVARADLAAATFSRPADRPLDRSRSRWSFSAIVSRGISEADPWDLTIEDEGADDEQRPPDSVEAEVVEPDPSAAEPSHRRSEHSDDGQPVSALAWLPAGAAFGTLTHDVLERVDFSAEDLSGELSRAIGEQQRWRSLSLRPVGDSRPWGDPDAEVDGAALLAAGLVEVVHTSLGPAFARTDGAPRRLRDIPPEDRLNELGFELNLHDPPEPGAGSTASRAPTDRDLGALLHDGLPADDPFRSWARRLASGVFGVDLSGHLTGSIDVVVRLRGTAEAPDRFVVVDYKTNRLHDHGAVPRPGDYGTGSMQRAMVEHHYPLQALLYLVALHRYLRWRLDGYDPDTHLGGAAYLFVRGMTAGSGRTTDTTPAHDPNQPEGVCAWTPPASVVVDASDLLAGRRGPAPRGEQR
jgi:exodeoxyribonuclease V beta subunit